MRSNRKHLATELAQYIQLYVGGYSYRDLCENHGFLVDHSTFTQYYYRFLEHDQSSLKSTRRNNAYSKEFKQGIVQEYFQIDISIQRSCQKI